jgi:hypothetical protein
MDPRSTKAGSEPHAPRTGGKVAGLAPVQIALGLLVLFLGLLALWAIWPLLGSQ